MTQKSPKIVFFGSGPVAAESLKLLVDGGFFDIEAVITKPKPAHHRGSTPVNEYCIAADLPFHTPASKKELTECMASLNFESSVGIVIDYGIIIEQAVIDSFEFGIINSHFSLLPQWRGADPITFAILSGQPVTGVSLMSINAAMDEGQLLTTGELEIDSDDTSSMLTTRLIELSNTLLRQCLPKLLDGTLKLYEQIGSPTYSRKLAKADGIVDWTKSAEDIEREIRGFYEWPKSTAKIGAYTLLIRSVDVVFATATPGSYVVIDNSLTVYCGKNALRIKSVQPPGKKEMPIQAFLNGNSL